MWIGIQKQIDYTTKRQENGLYMEIFLTNDFYYSDAIQFTDRSMIAQIWTIWILASCSPLFRFPLYFLFVSIYNISNKNIFWWAQKVVNQWLM